jgi:hypothetical protein
LKQKRKKQFVGFRAGRQGFLLGGVIRRLDLAELGDVYVV